MLSFHSLDRALNFDEVQFMYYRPGSLAGKGTACNAGDPALIPGLERASGEGNGNPLHSCLENPMDDPWGCKELD